MARIVVVSGGIAGIMAAHVECGRRLRELGHDVTIAAQGERDVEADGMAFVRLPGKELNDLPRSDESGLSRVIGDWRTRLERRSAAADRLAITEIAEILTGLEPELVLVDAELHPVVLAARSESLHVAVTTTFVSNIHRMPGVPPLHTAVIPGRGWRGHRRAIDAQWAWYRGRERIRRRLSWVRNAGVDPLTVLEEAADRHGLDLAELTDRSQWLRPVVPTGLVVVAFTHAEFDFPHAPDPLFRRVGPMMPSTAPNVPVDERLVEMLAHHASNSRRSLVYCSFGAAYRGDDGGFTRSAIATLSAEPDLDVVVGLGGRIDPASLGEFGDHVLLLAWAPQQAVLAAADVAVIHGGINTVNECIAAAVPMVIYPFSGVTDQDGTAARVDYHDLGIVDSRKEPEASVADRVRELLADRRRRENVEKLRSTIEAANRPDQDTRLADVVDELLRSG